MNGAATVAVANRKIIEEYSKSLQVCFKPLYMCTIRMHGWYRNSYLNFRLLVSLSALLQTTTLNLPPMADCLFRSILIIIFVLFFSFYLFWSEREYQTVSLYFKYQDLKKKNFFQFYSIIFFVMKQRTLDCAEIHYVIVS